MTTIQEIKRHNKQAGRFFFDKGNGRALPRIYKDKYFIAGTSDGNGYHVWEYDKSNGHINMVLNPALEYDFKPMKLEEAKKFALSL